MATSPELHSSFLFCLAPGLKRSPNQTWQSKVFAGWSPPRYGFLLVFTHILRGLSDSTRHRQLRLDWHPHGLATSNSSTHQHPPPMREPSSNGSLGRTPAGFVGDERVPFTCSAEWGAECRVNSDARAIGCCLSTACNIWTACLPYTSSRLASNRDTDRTMYWYALPACSHSFLPVPLTSPVSSSDLDEPECATLVYADGDYSGWTIPLCAATSVVLPIFDITSGSTGGVTTGGGGGRSGVAGPSGVANPTDGGGVANPTDSVNDDNNNNRNLDTANSNGKTPEEAVASTVNTALIVGAVVGGISTFSPQSLPLDLLPVFLFPFQSAHN